MHLFLFSPVKDGESQRWKENHWGEVYTATEGTEILKSNHERILKEDQARKQNRLVVNDYIKDQIQDRLTSRVREQGLREQEQADRLKQEEAYQKLLQVNVMLKILQCSDIRIKQEIMPAH